MRADELHNAFIPSAALLLTWQLPKGVEVISSCVPANVAWVALPVPRKSSLKAIVYVKLSVRLGTHMPPGGEAVAAGHNDPTTDVRLSWYVLTLFLCDAAFGRPSAARNPIVALSVWRQKQRTNMM